jgi:N-acetylneuraminic acid mutarotase
MFSVKTMATLVVALLASACAADEGLDASSGDLGNLDAGRDVGSDPDAAADAGVDGSMIDAGAEDGALVDAGDPLGVWSSAPDLPLGPRQETAVVALADELWVIGGFDGAGAFGSIVEIYTPSTDAWRRGPDLPAAMHHANAAAIDGKIYVLGFLGNNFAADNRCFRWDSTSGWQAIGTMPAGRQRGSSATLVHDGAIYLVGGFRNLGAVPDVDVFDPDSEAFSPLPPLPRSADHLVATAIGDRIYAVGGRTGSITPHTTQLDIYDPGSGQWSLGPPMPTSRGGSAIAAVGRALYVLGGEGNSAVASGVFDQVERYDRDTNLWTTLRPMTPGRHGTGAAVIEGRIYVPGGADVQAFGAIATVAVFNP